MTACMRLPLFFLLVLLTSLLGAAGPVRAEVPEVKIATGPSIGFLPYYVMAQHKIFEKHAKLAGLPNSRASFVSILSGAAMNDALISGSLHFSPVAVPGFLTLWAKTRDTPQEVKAVSGLNTQPIFMNTRNADVRTVRDFSDRDRIAVTDIKVSIHAIIVQMAAAQAFGDANYARLDPLTVGLPHANARDALLSGSGSVTTHMATEPFSSQELKDPKIHTVLTSYDVLGGPASVNLVVTTARFRKENPKTYAAFIAALNETMDLLNRDKRAAAEIFVRETKAKSTPEEVLLLLLDKKNPITFGMAPQHTMKFADFMHKVGTIGAKPASWKDLFFPEVHQLAGS